MIAVVLCYNDGCSSVIMTVVVLCWAYVNMSVMCLVIVLSILTARRDFGDKMCVVLCTYRFTLWVSMTCEHVIHDNTLRGNIKLDPHQNTPNMSLRSNNNLLHI